ncbi:conserved hypothetical protein [Lebetimonas natsushimae]|uniref:3-keto-disaccharide hydrolase domain-containing protein n=1 Tax=Lebetimonas natsushimae TaxID=1936991 RepID=A0A292YC04_9BACT|nr:CsgG/HfaB family protein [Lebetimonas natsushimae]GAX87066.1 conserved hypothetical protein [Lebetimonas natsushimae]
MKKWYLLFLPILFFLGCGEITTNVSTSGQNINEIAKYHGPKARIAVASFKCKAAKCNGEIGTGIADMLTTALFNSGRFIVLERGEGLEAIEKEYNLGTVRNRPTKNLEGADILVVGAITAFEPKAGGIGAGGIVIPSGVPFIGGIKFGKNEAYIAADIRLIDTRTGRIINATRVEGQASKWNIGGLGGAYTRGAILGGGLSVYKNTPMEKAIRVMIDNAVKAISKLVPDNYYRYDATGHPVSQNQSYNSGSTGVYQEKPKPKEKLIFSEDFEKYGIGQTAPFGPWSGKTANIKIATQPNGQLGKVLKFRGYSDAHICLKKYKLRNFHLSFYILNTRDRIYECEVNLDIRKHENPYYAYRIWLNTRGHAVIKKKTSDSTTTIADNSIKIPKRKWDKVDIYVKDNNIKVYEDNSLIIEINDNDKMLNSAGYICFYQSGDALIDDIKIYTLK